MLVTGADTGIHSGGCEILKRENYTKKEKREIFYLNYFYKIRSDSNVFNCFLFWTLYRCFSEKGGKLVSFLDFILTFLKKRGKKWASVFAQGDARF